MYLVYLAAGRGSRLPKKYRQRPKCLTQIKKKTIFERNVEFFNNFKKKIIITGYKRKKLSKLIYKYKFKEVVNHKYKDTNMVHSLFLIKNLNRNEDIIVCYGDVIFKHDLYKKFKNIKGNIMPINSNWLSYWKKRMNMKMIKNDAENLIIKKKIVRSIGKKIYKKFPKYQYMGVFKLSFKSFKKMKILYKKIQNKKIDMTNFLNLCIENQILLMRTIVYSDLWHEIDNIKDIKIAEKELI